ncbi:TPA: phage tail protein [Salmonella enterica]|nr:phage tail protein [Salmonella enterica]
MAESQFYAILTDQGAALEATALATGIPVTLDKFVIGDGGGNAVTPDPTRTTLVNEVYRGTIKKAESQDNQVTFTLYVPPEVGGYTIREAGILTADGTLYSLSNSPDILKPTESNGAVISITFRYTLAVSSTSTVNIVVYDDYLTPDAADAKYLQIKNNLSEIKENGANAQKVARQNINAVASVNGTQPDADGNITINIPSVDGFITGDEANNEFLRTDKNLSEIKENGANAQKAARQNINAVASVNGAQPDANGNVTISTGSTVDLSNYYTKSEVDALINSGDYASATPGAVGSYGTFSLADGQGALAPNEGAQLNGSSIKFAGLNRPDNGDVDFCTFGSSPAGIWRVISWGGGDSMYGTLFFAVRIS